MNGSANGVATHENGDAVPHAVESINIPSQPSRAVTFNEGTHPSTAATSTQAVWSHIQGPSTLSST